MTKEEFISQIAKSVQKYAPQFNINVCSPIIAQACLESAYGTSSKSKYHNYFGLKYRSNRVTCNNGYFNDSSIERTNSSYKPITSDWYKFENLDKGVLGYFQFTDISIYNNVKNVIDPKEYITKLKNDGYASDPSYIDKIMKIINDNNLTKFDNNQGEMIKMAYTFKKNMLPSSKYSLKAPYSMTPKYITIHNTANSASAANEVSYMLNNSSATSYHVCVDEKEVIQAIPFNRNAWHCGDGSSVNSGNRTSIGIEIARSTSDISLFKQAEANAAKYVATLLKQYGWGVNKLKRHYDWSGKNCPHRTIELGWQRFVNMVQTELDALNKTTTTKPTTNSSSNSSSSSSLTGSNFTVRIKSATLNIRKSADFNSAVVGTVKKGEVYTITKVSNGLGQLKSGAGWISMNTQYVEKVTTTKATTEYKVKIVNCTTLNVRAGAGTNYKVTTTVKKGEVYTIVDESNGWLKLKSGAGWISKTYTSRV